MSTVASRRFSLIEIEDATNNFENILGSGGESIVFLGQISGIGNVAVKKLKSNLIDFREEIEIVSKIKHPNLLSLHGYCDESNQKMLVYEYMEKGSLSNYIIKKKTVCLSWQQRLNICLGVANGLRYLHKEREELPKGIIHRDIKPDNILLDHNWVAKVSDFGICKLSHDGQIKSTMISLLKGTSGYYAPEYVRYGRITRKIDVYAFGVVLFQVLCRKMPLDRDDESYYKSDDEDLGIWARENVDIEIYEEISEDCLEIFTHIIGRSLLQNPSARPTMDDVVIDLECALKSQECQDVEICPKDTSSRGKVSIPGSVQKMIQNIKEMKITKNSEDEIYSVLKECSMDPFQTIQKLLMLGRISGETASERPKSSTTIAGDNDRGIAMILNEQADVQFPTAEISTESKLSCLSWNPYTKSQIASSDYKGIVTIWDVSTCQSVKTFEEHEKRAWSVDFSCTEPSMLVSGSDDCKVKIWCTNQTASAFNIVMKANVCSVKYNPGSSFHVAVGSANHRIYYYDLRNISKPLYIFRGHRKAVSYVKFLSNYELASASTDISLRLWDVKENRLLRTFKGHVNVWNFVGFSVNSEYIACGSETNEVFAYHKANSRPAAWHRFDFDSGEGEEDAGGSNFITAVCWKSDSTVMLSANNQGTTKVLQLVA